MWLLARYLAFTLLLTPALSVGGTNGLSEGSPMSSPGGSPRGSPRGSPMRSSGNIPRISQLKQKAEDIITYPTTSGATCSGPSQGQNGPSNSKSYSPDELTEAGTSACDFEYNAYKTFKMDLGMNYRKNIPPNLRKQLPKKYNGQDFKASAGSLMLMWPLPVKPGTNVVHALVVVALDFATKTCSAFGAVTKENNNYRACQTTHPNFMMPNRPNMGPSRGRNLRYSNSYPI